ncbi:Innexin [Ancylostoma ceylanicum]|uniref:Innexin n=1 Tax=Ancylostoma ceylanicum TaxID=53326 RepID=A0A0D6L7F8_9BILA|nr:Innexin [Ancylostoma ceylanicum]
MTEELGKNLADTLQKGLDDSGIDRLNYYYSTMVIMVLSVTITAKQYVGSPLQCWVPAQFTKAWEQYAENYCFVYNTYWVRPDEDVPESVDTRSVTNIYTNLVQRIAQQLIYYQWVPFIMALEAALFYLPVIFWSQDAGKEKKVNVICTHLEDSVELQHSRCEGASFLRHIAKFGQLDGTYVSKWADAWSCSDSGLKVLLMFKIEKNHFSVYLLTKMLYVINLAGQFFMMNKFLGQNDPYWGIHILSDILTGTDWELSGESVKQRRSNDNGRGGQGGTDWRK